MIAHTHIGQAIMNPTQPPPSYDSLFGELKAAKQESSGTVDFMQKFFTILFASVGFIICMALMLAIPIAYIIIGAKYKDDCPVEKYIPIYLIVAGAFGILSNLISLTRSSHKKRKQNAGEEVEESSKGSKGCEGILNCFLMAWFIAGNVWIYRNYKPNFDNPHDPKYCHQTLYLFAFWATTAVYILAGVVCCCGCCIAVVAAAVSG
eukprot:gene16396-7800_t